MTQHGWFQRIITLLVCLLASVFLVACNSNPSKSDDNPLPNYHAQYERGLKPVTIYYCRLLNRRTRHYYIGTARTLAQAKDNALQRCKISSRIFNACTKFINYHCAKRKQLIED